MKIGYTVKPNYKILINSIEDSPDWNNIIETEGDRVKCMYFEEFPFYIHNENEVNIYYPTAVLTLAVGETYSEKEFEKCCELIEEADTRLHDIINFEEDGDAFIWESFYNF